MTRCASREEDSLQENVPAVQPCDLRLESLRELSAQLGFNPLLVQASSGNTSIKADGVLWIKASGKWLQDAKREEMFVPLELAMVRNCIERNIALPRDSASTSTRPLYPSVETFLHAVVPQPVVVHVHSVNTIAWAVRHDAKSQLARRLSGLRWCLVPYASSGFPLALEIGKVTSADSHTNVFVLANHGLVVCGEDCDAANALLSEVERRLEIEPRKAPNANRERLIEMTQATQWRLPDSEALHALGTDSVSLRILTGGILYPCQALFLGRHAPVAPCSIPVPKMECWIDKQFGVQSFVILEGSGVLVSASIGRAELAMLGGLAQVAQRLGAGSSIRYLSESDVSNVLTADGIHYRDSAERS